MSTRSTSILRGVLLGVVPLVAIVAGGVMYASGGRYVTSENAYVKADIIQISPQVEGQVAEVLVRENAEVKKGTVLFRLDRRPFEIATAEAEAELAAVRHKIASMRADYDAALSESESAKERVRYLKLEVERQGTLKSTGFAARAKEEKAEHELAMAKRSVRSKRQQIGKVLAELGDISTEARRPASGLPTNSQFLRPVVNGRISRSVTLLSMPSSPLSR